MLLKKQFSRETITCWKEFFAIIQLSCNVNSDNFINSINRSREKLESGHPGLFHGTVETIDVGIQGRSICWLDRREGF